jgi:hypothetical protein
MMERRRVSAISAPLLANDIHGKTGIMFDVKTGRGAGRTCIAPSSDEGAAAITSPRQDKMPDVMVGGLEAHDDITPSLSLFFISAFFLTPFPTDELLCFR